MEVCFQLCIYALAFHCGLSDLLIIDQVREEQKVRGVGLHPHRPQYHLREVMKAVGALKQDQVETRYGTPRPERFSTALSSSITFP